MFKKCVGLNNFYWQNYVPNELIIPNFFEQGSKDWQLTETISNLIKNKDYDKAISTCRPIITKKSSKRFLGFFFWSQYAKWKQGSLKTLEFIKTFEQMRKKLKNHYFLSYNKALLYIRIKNFESAVNELNEAIRLEPKFAGSETVLFWIYYFEEDSKYLQLYQKVKVYLSAQQRSLIERMEGVVANQSTSLFAIPEIESIEQDNSQLLKKLPELDVLIQPKSRNCIFIAADDVYAKNYVSEFVFSKLELQDEQECFGIHVHLYNPSEEIIEKLKKHSTDYPQLNLSLSREQGSTTTFNTESPSYYASARFFRAFQLVNMYRDVLNQIIITDADAILKENLFAQLKTKESIGFIYNECSPKWERFSAGLVSANNDEVGFKALEFLSCALLKNFQANNSFWFIDQVALYLTNNFLMGNIDRLNPDRIFGKNLKHETNTLLWTYTNEAKTADNPLNRERQRLKEKYDVQLVN